MFIIIIRYFFPHLNVIDYLSKKKIYNNFVSELIYKYRFCNSKNLLKNILKTTKII